MARVSQYTRVLSHLREATIPLSIATADYAVRKYEKFIELSHLRDMIANGEKDIEAIDAFRQRHEDQRETQRSEAVNRMFAIGGGLLAALAIIITLPSLWTDWLQTYDWILEMKITDWRDWLGLVVVLTATGLVLFSLFRLARWTRSQIRSASR